LFNNISLGPPMAGVAELKSQDRDLSKGFAKEFKENLNSKLSEKMKPTPENKNQGALSKESPSMKQPLVKSEKLQKIKAGDSSDKKTVGATEEKDETSNSQAAVGLPTKKSQRAREEEIQKFMDSFEGEFGIPSTRIVEAFSQLNKENLEATPEQSADVFISKLQLSAEDEDKAKAMYLGMLGQLQLIDQKTVVPSIVPANQQNLLGGLQQDRLLTQQDRKLHLQNTLDQMNQRFWMKAPAQEIPIYAQPNPEALEKAVLQGLNDQQLGEQALGDESVELKGALAAAAGGRELVGGQADLQNQSPLMSDQMIEQKVAQWQAADPSLTPQQAQQLMKEMKSEQLERSRMKWSEGAVAAAMGSSAMSSPQEIHAKNQLNGQQLSSQVMAGSEGRQAISQQAMANQDSADSFQGQSNASGKSQIGKSEISKSTGKADFDSTLAGLGAGGSLSRQTSQHVGDMASLPASAGGPVENKEMNLQQVMNQAQYLIKKGGGEMKVKLSPEGMGDLHLKVLVQDGKVNMQMSAENAETKKLLESSVADLKHSLSSHKLSVESIKIDSVNQTNTDMNSQNSKDTMNFNQQQARQENRQFWNQFQESFGNRGQQRDNALETPNLRGYGKKQDALQPLDSSVSAKAKRTDGRGQGLDLVA